MESRGDTGRSLASLRPLLEIRASAYDLLRLTFLAEPTRELVGSLKGGAMLRDFPFMDESVELAKGAGEAADWMSRPQADSDEFYEELHWDYTRMFIGPYELPAPAWESAYCNEERLLFQKETLEVRRAYLRYGYLPKEFGREADDHLGLELDFMFQLSAMAVDRADAEDWAGLADVLRDQKGFLDEHLLQWVPQWSRDVVRSAQTGFYRGMAQVLQGFLGIDREALDEALAALNQPAGAKI
jgi:TorA maturation chaperone TorD